MDPHILLTGLLIFLARAGDVSLGTVRTIATVQGRMAFAFTLGLFEVVLWLLVITVIVNRVQDSPLLIAFYAFGFSTGNVLGILIERKLALGDIILKLYVEENRREVVETVRALGCQYTVFRGEGVDGPVIEVYVICTRREHSGILKAVMEAAPDVFYVTETPGTVRRMRDRLATPPTGWRAILKRK